MFARLKKIDVKLGKQAIGNNVWHSNLILKIPVGSCYNIKQLLVKVRINCLPNFKEWYNFTPKRQIFYKMERFLK